MKTLYVHIGTPKTGTTAIQYFCAENREVLAKKGFLYPDFPYRYEGKGKNRNGLFLTTPYLDENKEHNPAEEQRIFEEGLARIRELFAEYDNLILSNEGIWSATKRRRKNLWTQLHNAAERDGYTVKAIVYLRRQDEFAVSLWNQRIKGYIKNSDITETWEYFFAHRDKYMNLDYYKTLHRIAAALGEENLIVRRYDKRSLKDGLSQADFLDALGLTLTDEYVMDRSLRNEKLSPNGCEIKRVINGMDAISSQEHRFFQSSLSLIAKESDEEYPCVLLDAQAAKAFMEEYETDNQKIAERFIRDGQPLFSDRFSEEEVWQQDNPHMVNDLIRFAASSELLLLRQNAELKSTLARLQQQLEDVQRDVTMLRAFRRKVRHPFQAVLGKIS